jgi:hypothetical protein
MAVSRSGIVLQVRPIPVLWAQSPRPGVGPRLQVEGQSPTGVASGGPPRPTARVVVGTSQAKHLGKLRGGGQMATPERRGGIAGISTGGLVVIAGILLMIFWSVWIGLIAVLVGLIAFGGFAGGKWY